MMDRRDDIALAIVGDGPPYRRELESLFAGTATLFPGFMEGEELASAFASADGFVFPSVTETLGSFITEAWPPACLVAARSGPPPASRSPTAWTDCCSTRGGTRRRWMRR